MRDEDKITAVAEVMAADTGYSTAMIHTMYSDAQLLALWAEPELDDEQKVRQVIEDLVADGYDRDLVENGMGTQELLDIWAADHDEPVAAPAADTDVSPWLWETGRG